MCIIIVKDKKMRTPSEKELKRAFESNQDGAGFMYTDNGKVIIDKGYMVYEDFIREYKNLCKRFNNFKNKSLVIHCRIGTSGTNTPGNTHPYPLTNSIKNMQKIDNKCDIGIAHNGIIHDFVPASSEYNDTQEFIKEFVYKLYKFDNNFYTRTYYRDLIKDISGSKFAILDKDDNLYLIGDYLFDNNLKFSNNSYKPFDERYADMRATYAKYYHWNEY